MPCSSCWWTAVVVTAGSERQAERYRWEIHRRREQGTLPAGATYIVVPDPCDRRMGTGGATLHALRASELAQSWDHQRVLLLHAGGDSRRLPQYSLSGKLFSTLPVKTAWGETSTVFDETLALSTAWVERLGAGLLIGAGDVILTFDAAEVDWSRPGITGIAMRQPPEFGAAHGVYVVDELGRVYAFLQKPSVAEVRAAGGLLPDGAVAVDTGLLRLAPDAALRLTELARLPEFLPAEGKPPIIDLYEHVTGTLTGQWTPAAQDPPIYHRLAAALSALPFSCSIVEGDFTHLGTTSLFRKVLTAGTEFSTLQAAHQRLGATAQPGLRSAGVLIDSVLSAGGEIGPEAVVIECNLDCPVLAARGSLLHGLEGLAGPVEIPEDTVVHQVPVALPDGRRGIVIRVYAVGDDPKTPAATWKATWFGRELLQELRSFGMDLAQVWPGLPPEEWTLWNARLFPVGSVEEAWACARWLLHLDHHYSVERWKRHERLSLATSTDWADSTALGDALKRRSQANWQTAAVMLAASGSDTRPLLAHAPGIAPLAKTGQALRAQGRELEAAAPAEAASRYYQAGLFLAQAGLTQEAEEAHGAAFRMVEQAVGLPLAGAHSSETLSRDCQGVLHGPTRATKGDEDAGGAASQAAAGSQPALLNRRPERPGPDAFRGAVLFPWVTVGAPARIDMGGGWSDTPPFCLDWGGTVLNIAVLLNGEYPIRTELRRVEEPVVRCHSSEDGQTAEYRELSELLAPACPGDPFAVPRTALQMTGLFESGDPLQAVLKRLGGGIEIRTLVDLPMGSGLGTSSILAASILRALAEMLGRTPENQALSDQVMRLEQLMTTGGGWQDQAGGIFPGAKLILSGPGLRQRLRVQPVGWTPERQAEFESLMVLHYTGIRRVAKDLLRQVVGRYLARETATVQVLHSIKTLAMEMGYAMQEGDWEHLGALLDRHWALNQVLDPHTTNAPLNTLLERSRPYIWGAKLAGAGGGGFLMLLAKSPAAACELKAALAQPGGQGAAYDWKIAKEGLRVERGAISG